MSRSTPARTLISIIDHTAQPRTGSLEGVWFGTQIGTKPSAPARNLALNVILREFSLTRAAAESAVRLPVLKIKNTVAGSGQSPLALSWLEWEA